MTVPASKFHGVADRPDFRYVGLVWEVGEYEIDVASKEDKTTEEDPEYKGTTEDDPEYKGKQVVAKQHGKGTLYAPLQAPDLFLSFSRLVSRGKPSQRSVLRWVQKYGLLHKTNDSFETRAAYGGLNQEPVFVKDFVAEARNARAALNLYTDLNTGGIERFRKRLVALREQADSGLVLAEMDHYLVRELGKGVDKMSKYDSGILQALVTVELQSFVKDKLGGIRLALWSDFEQASWAARYKPTQSWECPDLISAMYLQFYLMMTQNLAMRRCKNPACEMPIPMTRKNRKFCNPTCRSNMRHYPEPEGDSEPRVI